MILALFLFLAAPPCDWQPGKWGVVGDYVYHTYYCPKTRVHKITICCVDDPKANGPERLKLIDKVTDRSGILPRGSCPRRTVEILFEFLPKPRK